MGVDVVGVDDEGLAGLLGGVVGDVFHQPLHHRVQTAGTYVLGALVDLPGRLGQTADAVLGELDLDPFGGHQRLVLIGQGGVRLGQDPLEVMGSQCGQLDPDRQATLQLGDEVRRTGHLEGAGGDEQYVVCLDHAVLGVDGATLDQRQQVTLYPFTGDIGARALAALADLVDLVEEDDAVVLDRGNGLLLQLFRVDQAGRFLFDQRLHGLLDLDLALLLLLLAQVLEQPLQLVGHLFHARRGHDVDAHGGGGQIQLDLLVIQLTFPQFLAEDLAGVGVVGLLLLAPAVARVRQQGVEDALLGGFLGAVFHLLHLGLAHQLDGDIGEIADDAVHFLAHIAHFGELGRFHLDEGGVGQLGQTTGDLGLADPGRAYHQDVFRGHFMAHLFAELHPAPAVAQGHGHRTLGIGLTDDVSVQLVDDFSRGHLGHDGVPVSGAGRAHPLENELAGGRPYLAL